MLHELNTHFLSFRPVQFNSVHFYLHSAKSQQEMPWGALYYKIKTTLLWVSTHRTQGRESFILTGRNLWEPLNIIHNILIVVILTIWTILCIPQIVLLLDNALVWTLKSDDNQWLWLIPVIFFGICWCSPTQKVQSRPYPLFEHTVQVC